MILVIDKHLANDLNGDHVVNQMREYATEKYPTYKKAFYISYTADLAEVNPLYDGFLAKPSNKLEVFGALHSALEQVKSKEPEPLTASPSNPTSRLEIEVPTTTDSPLTSPTTSPSPSPTPPTPTSPDTEQIP